MKSYGSRIRSHSLASISPTLAKVASLRRCERQISSPQRSHVSSMSRYLRNRENRVTNCRSSIVALVSLRLSCMATKHLQKKM